MYKQVHEAARACKTCQVEARQYRRAADLGAPRLAGTPMQELVIDMQTHIGEHDLLTVLDMAIRWQWIIPLSRKTKSSVPRDLSDLRTRFYAQSVRLESQPSS